MSNPKAQFKYYGVDFADMKRDERPLYCRFAVYEMTARGVGRRIVEFYTDRYLQGRYELDESTGTFRQLQTPYQFSMMGLEEQAIRIRLKKEALAALDYKNKMANNEANSSQNKQTEN